MNRALISMTPPKHTKSPCHSWKFGGVLSVKSDGEGVEADGEEVEASAELVSIGDSEEDGAGIDVDSLLILM